MLRRALQCWNAWLIQPSRFQTVRLGPLSRISTLLWKTAMTITIWVSSMMPRSVPLSTPPMIITAPSISSPYKPPTNRQTIPSRSIRDSTPALSSKDPYQGTSFTRMNTSTIDSWLAIWMRLWQSPSLPPSSKVTSTSWSPWTISSPPWTPRAPISTSQ